IRTGRVECFRNPQIRKTLVRKPYFSDNTAYFKDAFENDGLKAQDHVREKNRETDETIVFLLIELYKRYDGVKRQAAIICCHKKFAVVRLPLLHGYTR
ncbi:MAG: hypothetical protein IT223_03395, partial [Crocinitomicaceae bacterium]|nr:hypothetical protein [Crocinitomicaceae bacterium]